MLEIAGVNPATTSTNSASSTSSAIPQIPLRTVSGSTTSSSSSATDLNLIPLEDLDYVKLATDQFGCRFLQKKLDSSTEYEAVRDLMYQGIQPFFLELILDPFGNYLIQKLCDYLTLDQKTTLIQDIYPNVFQISINQYGTRSLQKIIDTVDNESQIDMLIKGFSQQFTSIEQVVTLINDLNGNHVIQKCIFKFPPTKFDFIIDAIVEQDNIIKISTHKHGCCVLQKLLSVCTLQQIFKISVKIVQFLPGLINDQFGNYIIQFLLDIKELDFYLLGEIFSKLSNELCQLSCLKFSSNVVEKFVKKLFRIVENSLATQSNSGEVDDVVTVAMNILLTIIDIFTANLNILIRDNFGNYALQTLLDVKNYSRVFEYPTNPLVHKSPKVLKFSHEFTLKVGNLVILTKELLPSIKTTSYAKKIKVKVKAYAELTGISFTDSPSKKTGHRNPYNNYHRKQHTRNYSLPANAYNHQRNNSSASISSGFPQQPQPQQPQQQPQVSVYGNNNNTSNNINDSDMNISQLNFQHARGFSVSGAPTQQMFNQQASSMANNLHFQQVPSMPNNLHFQQQQQQQQKQQQQQQQISHLMTGSCPNVNNSTPTVNNFAFCDYQQQPDPKLLPQIQQQPQNLMNLGKFTPQPQNLFMGSEFPTMNYGNTYYHWTGSSTLPFYIFFPAFLSYIDVVTII